MVGHELAVLERPRPPAARPTSPSCRTRRCWPRPASAARARSPRSTSRVHPGEVVGLAGLLGSGRTELARLLFGADRADSGSVLRRGPPGPPPQPARAPSPQRIAFCSEDRKGEGIVADLTVRDNIVLALQARRGLGAAASRGAPPTSWSTKWITALDIRPADPDALIRNLSGGNQQKVLLARWLHHRAAAADPRRAHPRHRHRRQGPDPAAGRRPRRRRHGGALHLRRAGGGAAALRPRRRAARPAQGRRAAPRRRVDGAGHGAHRAAVEVPPMPAEESHGLRRATALDSLFWPVLALVALLVFDIVAVPGFFVAADPGRAPLRQPRRHPQERRADRAHRPRHDPRDRHPRASTCRSAPSPPSPARWPAAGSPARPTRRARQRRRRGRARSPSALASCSGCGTGSWSPSWASSRSSPRWC